MKVVLPYVSIQPNKLTTYLHYDQTGDHRTYASQDNVTSLDNRAHGIMSYKANKRVRLAIDWLLYLAKDKPLQSKRFKDGLKFKLNFITLTLSSKQKHSDNEIKSKLLNQFLTELREKYKCTNYLWRAESQSNGNIHFHICTDVFIPWRTLRTDWNRIQEKLGYISAYEAKSKKTDPNSTDIHSINAVRNLGSYLSKYCTKNSHGYTVLATKAQTQPFRPPSFLTYKHPVYNPKAKFYRQIHGKLWGQSQGLSKYSSAKCEITGLIQQELEFLQRVKKEKVTFMERATMYLVDVKELIARNCTGLATKFLDYVKKPEKEQPPPVLRTNIFEALNVVAPIIQQKSITFA
jgi:hypothetical protein